MKLDLLLHTLEIDTYDASPFHERKGRGEVTPLLLRWIVLWSFVTSTLYRKVHEQIEIEK